LPWTDCIQDRKVNNIHLIRLNYPRTPRPVIKSVCTPAPIIPYPTGRLVWGALSQALGARLRSCSPSGTFAGSSHTTLCALHRPNLILDRILRLRDGDSSGSVPGVRVGLRSLTPRRSFDLREISQQPLACIDYKLRTDSLSRV